MFECLFFDDGKSCSGDSVEDFLSVSRADAYDF